MSFLTKAAGSLLEKTLMNPATVSAVMKLGRFRLIELKGEGLKKSGWSPGDKLRVKLGDLELRTYTPFSWDDQKGVARLLAWLPGRGPGSAWAEQTRPGDAFFFKGPKESLKLSKAAEGPVVFFGDETAIGAAAALRLLRPHEAGLRFIFELDDPGDAEVALIALGMPDAVKVRKMGDSHLKEVRRRIMEWTEGWEGEGRIFLVGNQQSVKELKGKLEEKLGGRAKIKAKVYWREGKTGLD